MKRKAPLALVLMMASCSAPAPVAESLCNLPRNLAGWNGAEVRWKGLMIGTFQHGYALIVEDCQRRGIQIDWRSARSGPLIEEALRREVRERGLIRVDVSGKIAGGRLLASNFHRITIIPMNDDELSRHMRSLGF